MKQYLKLNEFQLGVVYTLVGILVIELAVSLIAPFNALRLVEELNNLMILSDPRLQNSHYTFRILALIVDYGVSYQTIALSIQPLLSISSLIILGLLIIVFLHPTKLLNKLRQWFKWGLMAYGFVVLLSISFIGSAFLSNSPIKVLEYINRAGDVAVFGGIGLSVYMLLWISQVIMSVVRQT